MALVNYSSREIQLKIVYHGPALAGKTTSLSAIHKTVREDHRGDLTSLDTANDRALFFNFMPLVAQAVKGFTTRFQVYTVPGQVTYEMTRRIVLRGVDGVVFVADSRWSAMAANVESFRSLEDILASQGDSIDDIPYVLQYNKSDLPDIAPEYYLEFLLNNRESHRPFFLSVATEETNVLEALNMLVRLVLLRLVRSGGDAQGGSGQKLVLA